MRYFLFVSILLGGLCACSPRPYRDLQRQELQAVDAGTLKPVFDKVLYRGVIDGKKWFKKFHFSGLLYIRNFPDSSTRVVFQGEMGTTFFDFGWDARDSFTVYQIIPQMDKQPLIRLLRKDFELLLVKGAVQGNSEAVYKAQEAPEWYTRFPLSRGYVLYISPGPQPAFHDLLRIENADEKRKVITLQLTQDSATSLMPAHIFIRHLRAGFSIDLKKIKQKEQDASE